MSLCCVCWQSTVEIFTKKENYCFCASSSTQQTTLEDIRYKKVESPQTFIPWWRQVFAFYKYLSIVYGVCHFLGIFNLPATEVPLSRPVSLPIGSWLRLLKRFVLFFFSYSPDCLYDVTLLSTLWVDLLGPVLFTFW